MEFIINKINNIKNNNDNNNNINNNSNNNNNNNNNSNNNKFKFKYEFEFGYCYDVNLYEWRFIQDYETVPLKLNGILSNDEYNSILNIIGDVYDKTDKYPHVTYLLSIIMMVLLCMLPSVMAIHSNLNSYIQFVLFDDIFILITFILIPFLFFLKKKVIIENNYVIKGLKNRSIKLNIEYYKFKLLYFFFLLLWVPQGFLQSLIYKKRVLNEDFFNLKISLFILLGIDLIFILFAIWNFLLFTKLNRFLIKDRRDENILITLNSNIKKFLSPMEFYLTCNNTLNFFLNNNDNHFFPIDLDDPNV
ncbi:hypothetical protein DDB_G0285385 [Dictyostelium discoideum AX4]|uniref:Putative uncharacterized transmembrane protein DDB_G0285385 n=1 Tax=Dictyostelium discoideum TaxID=44689 RepID=Y6489_DICDI|nr:hypothetical protein DDB_G0285385 [Dictyostelium discoideum AX4]Q54N94.1 RecName: Full=Putative uncharacterized transmembrane protein DDB_G0285385 [Dictyostelium discoideum]EAL64767.1 hypothetical protein DDB_G0285385 [Dictyostelium discoideum AX4]|eukprot:XP_638286.1 hypothetical protein DDB_G0285385 [Dictyostelium discoideum AX4]